jgi:hypothetical protein
MANVDRPNGFNAIAPNGSTVPMYTYTAANGVPMVPGDAVVLGNDGKITIATAASTSIFGVCQSKVNGVAGTVETVKVIPAMRDLVFSGQCSGDPAALIGRLCDIEGTTGIMELNAGADAVGVARIIGYEGNLGNEASANARVLFTWNLSQFA